MNQHLLWPIRRTGNIFKNYEKYIGSIDVFSSFLAPQRSAIGRQYHLQARSMLVDIEEMGLTDRNLNHIGHRSPRLNTSKCRKLYTDYTQQEYSHVCTEFGNERQLIDEFIHNLQQSKCYFGEAVFVLGPMGAGKTTVLMEEFRKHPVYKDYAYVDTDDLMEKLNGFDSERVEEFYPSARAMAIRLTDWLLNERISFVAEGTCVKYLELEDYMQRLKEKGYVIKVKHVNDIPLHEILKRTSKRKRKIPEAVVESIYYGSLKGLNELKKINVENTLFQEL